MLLLLALPAFISRSRTQIFRDILQNVRLQRHVHIYRPRDPAQLALPHIQHALNSLHHLTRDREAIPRLGGNGLHGWLQFREAQEVDICILLLVLLVFV